MAVYTFVLNGSEFQSACVRFARYTACYQLGPAGIFGGGAPSRQSTLGVLVQCAQPAYFCDCHARSQAIAQIMIAMCNEIDDIDH